MLDNLLFLWEKEKKRQKAYKTLCPVRVPLGKEAPVWSFLLVTSTIVSCRSGSYPVGIEAECEVRDFFSPSQK